MFKKPVYLALFVLINLGFLLTAYEGQAQGVISLPETGQKKCYNSSGTEISCSGTGQDGELQAGVEWPEPRFTVSADCVTDNLTGLMWAKNANLPNGKRTWQGALDYVASINSGSGLCGYKDWGLPNVNELESLINAGEANNATWLNTQGFSNVQSDYDYWSSTTQEWYTDMAWVVSMWYADVGYDYKSNSYYVWPIRSGQGSLGHSEIWKTGLKTTYATGDDGDLERGVAWPSPRFTDHGNGTITDSLTGLMWAKNANLLSGYETRTWQGALDYVKSINNGAGLGGYHNWRLPNKKELFSLIDRSRNGPALPLEHPFQNVQYNNYWSSTTYAGYPEIAWFVYMKDGSVDYNFKSTKFYVWPVRSGQAAAESRTLMVASSNPNSGVTITVSPNDKNGQGNGTTQFTRTYNNNTVVTLTAPSTAGGNNFQKWQRNGVDYITATTTTVTMDNNYTMTVVYTLCNQPGPPSNPSPQNEATGMSTSPTLSWSACANADSYDVYFGTSSPPPYVGNTTNTSYPRSGLNTNTTYYWKIVAKNNCGNSTSGPIWSFTTGTISTINITVTSPNGGENWKAGTTQTISWTYTGNPGKYVKIELLKGEAVNRTIAYRTSIGSGGNGSYSWRMLRFQTTGSDYKIRVTSFRNSSYTDTSDNNFTISK